MNPLDEVQESTEKEEDSAIAVMNCMRDGVVLFRADGRIQFINASTMNILGQKIKFKIGKHVSELFPSVSKRFEELLMRINSNNGTVSELWETEILDGDNRQIAIELMIGEVNFDRKKTYWIFFRNIEQKIKTEISLGYANIILDSVAMTLSEFIVDKSYENVERLYRQLLQDMITVTSSTHGFVFLHNHEMCFPCVITTNKEWEDPIRCYINHEPIKDSEFAVLSPYIKEAIDCKRTSIVNNIDSPEAPSIKYFVAIPLLERDHFVGFIGLVSDKKEYDLEAMRVLIPVLQAFIVLRAGSEDESMRLFTEQRLHERDEALKGTLKELELKVEEVNQAKEEAFAASKAKSSFLANMSHEIRTPLNGIMGMTEMLLMTELNEKQQRYAEVVYNSSEVLLKLLNDILDLSKIEAGELKIEYIDSCPLIILNEVIELLSFKASEKHIGLHQEYSPSLPMKVKTDPCRLRQILTNLIGNAIKFTESGSVKVVVTSAGKQDDKELFRFEVVDTGIGIAKEVQERLFKSFTQADVSITRKFGGTGLGLSISKYLVEKMNGKIGVFSDQGKGATFWFEIPMKVVAQEI